MTWDEGRGRSWGLCLGLTQRTGQMELLVTKRVKGQVGGMKRTGLGGSEVSWAARGLGGECGLLSLRQALESGREALWGLA